MIVVNAANGQQGKLLIPKLLAKGLEVRACVRSKDSAEALKKLGASDVVIGEIDDPATIDRALNGADTVYHLCPGIHPKEREIGFSWIDAALSRGIGHFVFSSVLHAIVTDLVQHEIKRDIEEHLISSNLEYTILQPAIYMAPRRFGPAIQNGELRAAWSLDRRQSLVDLGDVTDVAANILSDPRAHRAATYELVGTDPLTARNMGEIIGRVRGSTVKVEEIDADTYLLGLFGKKLDPEQHEARVGRSLHIRYSSHDFLGNPNVLGWLLGRKPTNFEQFIQSLAEAA
jgi:uncharacterized protein YbjT (DUF2867 family)